MPEADCAWADTGEGLAEYFDALRAARPDLAGRRNFPRWAILPLGALAVIVAGSLLWKPGAGGRPAAPAPPANAGRFEPRQPVGFDPNRLPGRPPRPALPNVPGRPGFGRE